MYVSTSAPGSCFFMLNFAGSRITFLLIMKCLLHFFFTFPYFSSPSAKVKLSKISSASSFVQQIVVFICRISAFLLSSVDMRYRLNHSIHLGHPSGLGQMKGAGGTILSDTILGLFGKHFLCARIPLLIPCNIR